MTTSYTFNLRNLEQGSVTMYLFLAAPEFSEAPEHIYQNSSTFLEVPLYKSNQTEKVVANVQYQLQVEQQTIPIKIGSQVMSSATQNAEVNTGYIATYSNELGGAPSLDDGKTNRPPEPQDMVVQTNPFSDVEGYYNALTFGVTTDRGMTGVTWVPKPNMDYAITPTLTFYIAVGSFQENELATIDATGAENAVVRSGHDGKFDQHGNTWVTYNSDGTWSVDNQAWSD